ncbi:MAG: SUMF1/EgtB/PvdO family nonheme iron enzyme [Methylococcales bacterium]|nr:SUMF1/EgtB/PvdO family nonheme iron enzyme [Methylococcales bacterium]
MADIFLSYARADLAKAELFVAALERQGWSVFWDISSLFAGQGFRRVIEENLNAAACVVVLWSETSINSDFVQDEAEVARQNKTLVPVLISAVKPPLGFRSQHSDDLSQWDGDVSAPAFLKLKRAISDKLAQHQAQPATTPTTSATLVVTQPPHPKPPAQAHIEPEMVLIPAGRFNMGSNDYKNEQPIHPVTIAQPFYLGKYPVTFAEYALFVKAMQGQLPDDRAWGMDKRPVINVSWENANNYAAWLSAQTGKAYRLPTEAEWEYACRAGTSSLFYWGDKEQDADNYAWFSINSGSKTHPVGEKQPNAWGLYDMAGNVLEWVQDCYVDNYLQAPNNGKAYQTLDFAARVVRGGSWNNLPVNLRSAYRYCDDPIQRYGLLGFRLAQD